MNAISAQARFLHDLSFSDLSEQTIHAAKRVLYDSIACIARGNRSIPVESLPQTEPGGVTIIGAKGKYPTDCAIPANGTAMVCEELDEGNQFAKGHPASHFISALLASAERSGSDGKSVITALVAAYEIAVRWGNSVTLRPEVHAHGNWGTASGAAAVAKLNGFSADQTARAICLAASLALPSTWESVWSGKTVRNAYIGMCNLIGFSASNLAQLGVESNEEVLQVLYGSIIGTHFNPALLDADLGSVFYIERNYFKPYPSCRYTHGAIDAVLKYLREVGNTKDIVSVKVATYSTAAKMKDKNPPNAFAARFSIPILLGLLFANGSIDPDHIQDAILSDERVRAFAERVSVVEDPACTRRLPAVRETKVTITARDIVWSCNIEKSKGDFNDPLSDAELTEKFMQLTGRVWNPDRQNKIREAIFKIEYMDDVKELMRLLEGGAS